MPLHVVPTPIGDPEDITLRALRVLGEADVVACEDTRTTAALLAHHGLHRPLVSFHDHNEDKRVDALLVRLRAGERVALVSEAGTPLVNDPGWPLVRACIDEGLPYHVLPGACAAITALVGSGLPTHRFVYAGFVPRNAGDRRRLWEELDRLPATVILYESPLRLAATLEELDGREVVVARNLTRPFEQWLRGPAGDVRRELGEETRGEVVLMLAPRAAPPSVDPDHLIDELLTRGVEPRAIRDEVVAATGLGRRDAYQRVLHRLARRG